jgi:formiminoglutamase
VLPEDLAGYQPLRPGLWEGRVDDPDDPESFRWHQVVRRVDLRQPVPRSGPGRGFCFLGFRSDEGVRRNQGRTGAAQAPDSIRRAMANLPCAIQGRAELLDAGDVSCVGGDLEHAQEELRRTVRVILDRGWVPVLLGGGHEIAFGHFRALADFLGHGSPSPRIGIVNFDAHFDLRPTSGGAHSGSSFLQVAEYCVSQRLPFSYFCVGIQISSNTVSLFRKAESLGTEYLLARDITEATLPAHSARLSRFLASQDRVYLTICADVFSSAFAPGVSAPQPFGLHPEIALKLIKEVCRSGKVAGIDVAEASPRFDHDDRTARLVAIVLFAMIQTLTE